MHSTLHRAIFLRFLFLKVFEPYLLWKIVCTSFVAYKLEFIYLCIPVCIKPQLMQFVQFSNSILNLKSSQDKLSMFKVRQGFKTAGFFFESGPMPTPIRLLTTTILGFYFQKFVDNTQQYFAFMSQANFLAHHLNFH